MPFAVQPVIMATPALVLLLGGKNEKIYFINDADNILFN